MGQHPPVTPDHHIQCQQWLNQAVSTHQKGHWQQAQSLYQQILKLMPQHPDALHLLGLLEHQQGNSPAGERLIRRAIAAQPQEVSFHTNLGEVCREQGKHPAAIRAYQKALQLAPRHLDALVGLAEAQLADGHALDASHSYQQALALTPQDATLWNNQGNAFAAAQQPDLALKAYEQALQVDPQHSLALENRVNLMAQMGQRQQAVTVLQAWLQDHPTPELYLRLAELQAGSWDRTGALCTLEQLPATHRDTPTALLLKGQLLEELGQLEAALTLYQSAAQAPQPQEIRAALQARIGLCHEQSGQREAAAKAYREALHCSDRCIAAWEGLQGTESLDERDAARIQKLARDRKQLSPADRARLEFVLANREEKHGHFDNAFAHYQAGNKAISKQRPFNPAAFTALTDQVIRCFDQPLFAAPVAETMAPTEGAPGPIFIVGMPRSGTTLVERILSGHPQIEAGGERDELRRLIAQLEAHSNQRFPDCMEALTPALQQQLRQDYRHWTENLATGGTFTDKLPSNYLRLGLIAKLFPNARIVHCQRDPRDTCLSCFTTHFQNGQSFSYRQDHLAHAYGEYRRLMAHWRQVLPLPILDLSYEQLVADPQQQGERLLKFCGFDWSPELLDFHDSAAPVRTASVWQVRQPLYRSSVARWQRFERHLQPLLKGLSPYLSDTP